jgi:hypothetical protein
MTLRPAGNSRGGLLFFLAAYAAALILLLPRLTLWLDEILTLVGAMQPDLRSFFEQLRINPGVTPLAFLVPAAGIKLLGYSVFAARITPAIFSVLACAGVFELGRRAGLKSPLAAVAVFALCPMQFRYAMEARPYALALCISVWASVLFLSLREHSTRGRIASYAALAIAGAYTLVFTLFVWAAHFLSAVTRSARRATVIAMAVAVLATLPIYLYARESWAQTVGAQNLREYMSWRSILLVLHELTGGGYFGTVLLLGGAIWGWLRAPIDRTFWRSYALIPAMLVPIADFVFHYFLATRQMIYVLAPLAVLFAAGAAAIGGWGGRALVAAFLAVSVYANAQWLNRPREDWNAAVAAVERHVEGGACVIFVPQDAAVPFTFFRPDLNQKKCAQIPPRGRVVLARSPYNPDGSLEIHRRGLTKLSQESFNGPIVELYEGVSAIK